MNIYFIHIFSLTSCIVWWGPKWEIFLTRCYVTRNMVDVFIYSRSNKDLRRQFEWCEKFFSQKIYTLSCYSNCYFRVWWMDSHLWCVTKEKIGVFFKRISIEIILMECFSLQGENSNLNIVFYGNFVPDFDFTLCIYALNIYALLKELWQIGREKCETFPNSMDWMLHWILL